MPPVLYRSGKPFPERRLTTDASFPLRKPGHPPTLLARFPRFPGDEEPDPLIEECYRQSVLLLLRNSSPHGILACSPSGKAKRRNYLSVFGRDASLCSMGMVSTGDSRLIALARAGLKTLARHQADNGQIPNYVKAQAREVNFWHLGCIDATLWWLIALQYHDRYAGERKLLPALRTRAEKAISWLSCQAHPGRGLLVQNEASDWADIMPRHGHVLYSNALWYRVKLLYRLPGADRTKQQFNRMFFPFSTNGHDDRGDRFYTLDKIRQEMTPTFHYLSYVSYLSWGRDVDLYGNALAVLFGLPPGGLRRAILKGLQEEGRNGMNVLPATLNPIRKRTRQWREYMGRHDLNAPHQYHNGGIWPYVGCFFAMSLAREGKPDLAVRALRNVAALNRVNDWQFNEWFHGNDGSPMGMPGQSWNAAMFLLACHFLTDGMTV